MAEKQGQLGRIDLLQARALTDADSARYIARELGLTITAEPPAIDRESETEAAPETPSRISTRPEPRPPTTPGDRPPTRFWYLSRREQAAQTTDSGESKPQAIEPEPWRGRPRQSPAHQPLLDEQSLLARLQPRLRQPRRGRKVDVGKVARAMSRAEYLQRLPRQSRQTEAMPLHLIDDRSRHLTSYWRDHHFAAETIYRHYTQATLSLSVLLDGEARPQQITADGLADWEPPHQGVVLIFSDLGALAALPQPAIRRWLAIGRALRRNQCRAIVLLPYAVERLDPRLKTLFTGLSWEPSAIASPLEPAASREQVDKLLTALAPAIRIEPGLLRAMRLAMSTHGEVWRIPAAIEALLWRHEAIDQPHSVAASWAISARQQYLQAFEQLTAAEKTTALETLRQWRADLAEKIWYEEIISLDQASRTLSCVQDDVEQANRYFEHLSEAFQDDARLEQVPRTQAWCRRLYHRLPKQRLRASRSLQRLIDRVYKDDPDFDRQHLDPQQLPPADGEPRQAVLYQQGNHLRLQPYDPFNPPDQGYSPLALIRLRREHVQVIAQNKVLGELRLDDSRRIQLPNEQALRVISDEETLVLQTLTALNVLETGRDTHGLYADLDLLGVTQRFRYIEPGTFMMGSPPDEAERYDDEDHHQVTLTKGYWLADTACTQALWQAVMGENPSEFNNDPQNPVESVSWLDAQAFLKKLNQLVPELQARLPSEAQWEYACRAGTTPPFNFEGEISLDKVNYRGTWDDIEQWGDGAKCATTPVKSYDCNAWGLYQMHGNVWEWCQDEWQENLGSRSASDPGNTRADTSVDGSVNRVRRGGSWFLHGRGCRSSIRDRDPAGGRFRGNGFRFSLGHELQPVTVSRSESSSEGSAQSVHAPARSGAAQGHEQAGRGVLAWSKKMVDKFRGKK